MQMNYNEFSSDYEKITRKMFSQTAERNSIHINYSSQREQQNLNSFGCFQMR